MRIRSSDRSERSPGTVALPLRHPLRPTSDSPATIRSATATLPSAYTVYTFRDIRSLGFTASSLLCLASSFLVP
jgi:hypothetical protein